MNETAGHPRALKPIAKFVLHSFMGTFGSLIVTFIIIIFTIPGFGKQQRDPWIDSPYTPLSWGIALIIGLLLNHIMRDRSAKWVWTVGVSELILFAAGDASAYDPRWCNCCSLGQYLWYSYFSYWNCIHECLGQLFGTTPMLNSFAYSLGAAVALRFKLAKQYLQ